MPAFPVLAHESCSWKGCGTVVITRGLYRLSSGRLLGFACITVGIILPSFILALVAASVLARHRANSDVLSFVKGAYAVAIGTILGACI